MEGKDFEELRQLVEFLKSSGIAEFEMERPNLKVRLSFAIESPAPAPGTIMGTMAGIDVAQLARLISTQGAVTPSPALPAAPASATPVPAAETQTEPEVEADPTAGMHIVKSPIVGTFYDAPSPDAEPFVQIGDRIVTGQVLCIVEAMKLMNEVESDTNGEIVKVLVKPGQPVEYGQALFAVKA